MVFDMKNGRETKTEKKCECQGPAKSQQLVRFVLALLVKIHGLSPSSLLTLSLPVIVVVGAWVSVGPRVHG